MRARDAGIMIGDLPAGLNNAITDVDGVRVGYATLIEGASVRTGVTVVLPSLDGTPRFAGFYRLNGNGEMTGTHWIAETGILMTPIAITNTLSVGAVHEGMIRNWLRRAGPDGPEGWHLPIVSETFDGFLNDSRGLHVRPEHALQAIDAATAGPIAEGNVGGGTGMICHGYKGGTGTASRRVQVGENSYTVGVLVQANHGQRDRFTVCGVRVGRLLGPDRIPLPARGGEGSGSIIVIVATDAPLLPNACNRLAQRAALGIGRTGGLGEDSSGDFILAFSTANRAIPVGDAVGPVESLSSGLMNPLFAAVVEAVEEAILNALLGAQTMTGYRGNTAHALDLNSLLDVLREAGHLAG